MFNHLVQTFLHWYHIILAKQHWTVGTTLVEIKKCNLQSYKSKPTVLTLLPDVTPSNLYTFCTITDTVHFTKLSLAQTGKFHLLFSELFRFVVISLTFIIIFDHQDHSAQYSLTKIWFYQMSWLRLNYNRERFGKLMLRALALRQSQ